MKNVVTLMMCLLCIISGVAQTDSNGTVMTIPDRTPELKTLYQQAKALEQNGTAAEINANRIAIKNAWAEIDPNMAALYTPIVTNKLPETVENIGVNGVYQPLTILERGDTPEGPDDWGADRLLRDDWVDGIDMDVTMDGDIYIGIYENLIDFGGTYDSIFLYRSTNGGNSFDEWKKVGATSPVRKMQIISMDGTGDEYLLAYLVTESETFQVWRWNMATGAFDAQVISSEVTDFGVDRNYPGSTNGQRVFATYNKAGAFPEIFSARSTAGSYGFDWADLASISGTGGNQVEFSYGINGGCYTTYTGYSSGSLYANTNPSSNDPASWSANEIVADGTSFESLNPTIRSTRKEYATDEVLILTSSRAAGSTDNYTGAAYLRENGAAFAPMTYVSTTVDYNIAHMDTWMRKANGDEVIETAYVRDRIDNSDDDVNRSRPYNGSTFDPYEGVGDAGFDVFDGFAAAVAETNDEMPCLAFAGGSGSYGYGLYFDAKTVLGVEENSFEDFKFYPNPAQDILNISAIENVENISIYSLLGQKMIQVSPNKNNPSIDISSLATGLYIMQVGVNGQSATYKIVKQ